MPADETIWHREVITADAEQVLVEMQRRSVLDGFYLAGGTGLALRFGHSRSHDLDFFSPEPVRENILIDKVARSGHFSVEAKAPGTLHATVQGIKVSFFEYAYPLLLPPAPFSGVPVAAALDISCMKLSAAASRGTKRDFIDLYVVAKQHGLRVVLDSFHRKFANVSFNGVHILKSLTYFDDAEKDPMPEMLIPVSWDEVKAFLVGEASRAL